MKTLTSIFAIIIALFMILGCNEILQPIPKEKPLLSVIPEHVYNTLVDSIDGPIDGIQIIVVDESGVSHGAQAPLDDDTTYNYYTSAVAVYRVNNQAGQITSSNCAGVNLEFKEDWFPQRYIYDWEINNGPTLNTNAIWTTVINGETIIDTIPTTNGFANLSFSAERIDLSQGGTLSWSTTSSGDVSVHMMWGEPDSLSQGLKIRFKFLKIVPDNGSCAITPSDLSDVQANVPLVKFHLIKGNLKTKLYDYGNKQMLTLSWTERSIAVRVVGW